MRKLRRHATGIALVTSLSILGTGCFGTFTLTRKVYEFNKGVGDKFVQSILFWAMTIVPIYSIAATVDIFILNLLEFWTGSNPLTMAPGDTTSQDLEVDGITLRLTLMDQGRTLQVARVVDGALVDVITMTGANAYGEAVAMDAQGQVLTTAHELAGAITVETSEGDVLASATAEELAPLRTQILWSTQENAVALAQPVGSAL